MRYLPDLIPKQARVLPEYFTGHVHGLPKHKKPTKDILSTIIAACFFILAGASLYHPILSLLFGAVGFVLLPKGHQQLERLFRFRFVPAIKIAFCIVTVLLTVPLILHYDKGDEKDDAIEAATKRAVEQAKNEEAEASTQRTKQLRDSLDFYVTKSRGLKKELRNSEALVVLSHAVNFVNNEDERTVVRNEEASLHKAIAVDLIKHGKYKEALTDLNSLIEQSPDDDLLCKRALCYSKTGHTQEAVNDLKVAMQNGSEEATQLHDKINPLRKRIINYLTRCCDGTLSPSNAKGRGACSHHGGVCDWNEPEYQEYRQYE